MITSGVENYPGFPDGILGPDLMTLMRKQAERFGAEFIDDNVKSVDFSSNPFKIIAGDQVLEAHSVILATGANAKWLGLESEQRLIGRGCSSCATCDGAFFRNKEVIVVGGGDSMTFPSNGANNSSVHSTDGRRLMCYHSSILRRIN